MMYLEHFGLREAPFRITPHTGFFFTGGNRGATLEALIYAITHDDGIVKISGDAGSGKTMLCRVLLERLPQRVETVYLANPSLSREEILFAIADELGMPLPEDRTHLLQRALQERLLEIYAAGRQVVVLIDEAHAMPAEALEEIRQLSNLESNRHKLLQVVLFGQPELDFRLAQTEMRQLKERITHNFALEPLQRKNVASYLMCRMRAAGYRGPGPFTPAAIETITCASEGLPRRVNILADKALLAAFAQDVHQVDQREARAAAHDAQFRPMTDSQPRTRLWLGIGSGGLLAVAGAAFLLSRAASEPPAAPTTAGAALPQVTVPQESSPRRQAHAQTTADSTGMPRAAMPLPARAKQPLPERDAPPPPPPPALGPLTTARLAASAGWLRDASGKRYFIQLMNTDTSNATGVESFLATVSGDLDAGQLRVYRSALSGRDRIGVIYGDFATLEQASAAMAALPSHLLDAKPYVRNIEKLR